MNRYNRAYVKFWWFSETLENIRRIIGCKAWEAYPRIFKEYVLWPAHLSTQVIIMMFWMHSACIHFYRKLLELIVFIQQSKVGVPDYGGNYVIMTNEIIRFQELSSKNCNLKQAKLHCIYVYTFPVDLAVLYIVRCEKADQRL